MAQYCVEGRQLSLTELPWLPNWDSKYICRLALVTEKEYQILSELKWASFHSYASFGLYRCKWLFNQTAFAALAFAGKGDLHISYTHTQETSDFWQLPWDKHIMSLRKEQSRCDTKPETSVCFSLFFRIIGFRSIQKINGLSTARLGTLAIFFIFYHPRADIAFCFIAVYPQ